MNFTNSWSIIFAVLTREERMQTIRDNTIYDNEHGKFGCGICFKEFKRKECLKNHFESTHLDFQGYECEYCGQKLRSQNNRRKHIHNHHREEHMATKALAAASKLDT